MQYHSSHAMTFFHTSSFTFPLFTQYAFIIPNQAKHRVLFVCANFKSLSPPPSCLVSIFLDLNSDFIYIFISVKLLFNNGPC